jgi:outer membrane protein TolC
MKKLITGVLFLILFSSITATEINPEITLQTAVETALNNSPEIITLLNKIETEKIPELLFENPEIELEFEPQNGSNQTSFLLKQDISGFFKTINSAKKSNLQQQKLLLELIKLKKEVTQQTEIIYFKIQAAQQELKYRAEIFSLSEKNAETAKEKEYSGYGTSLDTQKAILQKDLALLEKIKTSNKLRQLKSEMLLLWNSKLADFTITKDMMPLNKDNTNYDLTNSEPDIIFEEILALSIKILKADKTTEIMELIPDISIHTKFSNLESSSFDSSNISGGISITLPIFNQNIKNISNTNTQLKNAETMKNFQLKKLKILLRNELMYSMELRKELEIYKELLIPAAKKTLLQEKELYESSRGISYTDLLKTEQTYKETLNSYSKLLLEYSKSQSVVKFLTGKNDYETRKGEFNE